MTRKNYLKSLVSSLIVAVIFLVFCFFNIFQKLDYRLYDSLFHLKKEPVIDPKILIVEIDDPSINYFGEWPWSRDVIADALLRMKELNARVGVFDIEYLSPSVLGVSPTAKQKIYTSIAATEKTVNESVTALSNAVQNGFKGSELPGIGNNIIDSVIHPSFENLNSYISTNFYRNNDEYFGECLQFFGNAYLTVNNRDLGYKVTDEDKNYIKNRFLISNLSDPEGIIPVENEFSSKESYDGMTRGFQPALHSLLSRSAGVGFTNSVIDTDGTRRRFELFYEYDGFYLGQLVVAPLLDYLDVEKITRTKNFTILHDALIPGSEKPCNIKIPVDNHGRILLKFNSEKLNDSFKYESIINLIQLDYFESDIITSLNNIVATNLLDENGFEMEVTAKAKQLLETHGQIDVFKEYLLSKCTGFNADNSVIDGISDEEYEQYFGLRNQFFSDLKTFVDAEYLTSVKDRIYSLVFDIGEETAYTFLDYYEEDLGNLSILLRDYTNSFNIMKDKFNEAFCIIGNTAASTTDLGATPFQKKYENVGLHATLANTILNQDFIYYIDWYWGFLAVFVIAIILTFFSEKPQHTQNIIGAVVFFAVFFIFTILFVVFDVYIPFVGSLLYLLINYFTGVVIRFLISNREKQFITQIAASFANKDTVEELRRNPESFKTAGQKKNITALFSDIQSFSTFSERVGQVFGEDGPNQLIQLLNAYLGEMSNEILKNNGTIDKYEGDAIISMFGAPDPKNLYTKEEWAYLTLDSAIKMKQCEIEFNKTHTDFFKDYEVETPQGKQVITINPFRTRIGINSGEAFVGLMGSQTEEFSKMNYTMIGDTVNLASRLEGTNKAYKSWIMCSEDTWKMADSGANKGKIVARKLDRVRVVGKSVPVTLFNIIGFRNELSAATIEGIDIFNTAIDLYLRKDFVKAGRLFVEVSRLLNPEQSEYGDNTPLIYAERCKMFIEKGVPEKWDGIVNMTSK